LTRLAKYTIIATAKEIVIICRATIGLVDYSLKASNIATKA